MERPPPKKRRKQPFDAVSPTGSVTNAISPTTSDRLPQQSPHDYSSVPEPSLLRQTLGHQHFRTISYLGSTSYSDRLLLDLSDCLEEGKYRPAIPSAEIRVVAPDAYFCMLEEDQTAIEQQVEVLDRIEAVVAPHGPALVDLYFRIVHPSYPILHKDVFLEKHGRSYRELTPACLAAVYMLALNWWHYSGDLGHLTKPDVTQLEKLVPSLLSFDRLSKISDIQAGLLLLQRPRSDSWRLTAQLVAMAEDVGLHRDCGDWHIPDWEKGARKRTAWALFIQDKWGALVHGRPSHIKAENWEVLPLEFEDFPENIEEDHVEEGSSEVEKGILIFMQLCSLSQILSDIIDSLFTVHAMKQWNGTVEVLQIVKPLQLRLKSWYAQLPSCLAFEATQPRKLSATGHLYLAYLAAEVTLHRAIVQAETRYGLEPRLREITRGAAIMRFTSVIDFLKRLKPEHVQGFWHFASEPCLAIISTFSLDLLATSHDPMEANNLWSQIADFRWLLNINSPSADFMKLAVSLFKVNSSFLAKFRPQSVVTSSERPHNVQQGEHSHPNKRRGPSAGLDSVQSADQDLHPVVSLDQDWLFDCDYDFDQFGRGNDG